MKLWPEHGYTISSPGELQMPQSNSDFFSCANIMYTYPFALKLNYYTCFSQNHAFLISDILVILSQLLPTMYDFMDKY